MQTKQNLELSNPKTPEFSKNKNENKIMEKQIAQPRIELSEYDLNNQNDQMCLQSID